MMKSLHLIILATFLISFASSATEITNVYTGNNKELVKMELEYWLDVCPSVGMAPIKWRATNLSEMNGKWRIDFSASTNFMGNYATQSSFELEVPAGQSGEKTIYVPLGNGSLSQYGYHVVNYQIQGMGIPANYSNSIQTSGFGSYSSYIAASNSAVGKSGWRDLKDQYKKKYSKELAGSEVDMKKAPEDWRGYSGVIQLWMTDREWMDMSELRRQALADWLSMGGRLFILTEKESSEALAELKLRGGRREDAKLQYGAGMVEILKWDGKQFPVMVAADKLNALSHTPTTQLANYDEKLNLIKSAGKVNLNGGLIFGFIFLFGVLVGPVNLFWITKSNRSRLFWTTPAISLAGSILLMILMVVQDGFGGTGTRLVLMVLQPEAKRVSIMQEQVSRTGVLTNRSFVKHEPMMMTSLKVEALADHVLKSSCLDHETHGGGDWFASRSVQAQFLQTVRSSRAKVEFFPAQENGGAPEVLSSLGVSLKELWIRDEAGGLWTVRDLGTGERKKMVSGNDSSAYQAFVEKQALGIKGPSLQSVVNEIKSLKGYVIGVADEADNVDGVAIKTLDAIHWNKQQLTVIGPYELK